MNILITKHCQPIAAPELVMMDLRGESVMGENTGELLSVAMHTLLLHTEDYIFIKGADLKYRAVSQAAAMAAGLASPEDMVGRDDFSIFPQAVAQRYYEADMQILHTGESLARESEFMQGIQGTRRWTQIWKYPIRDAEGKICGIYGIGRDVTRLLALQENQMALREAVANSNVQYFTYFPDTHTARLYIVSRRYTSLPTHWENYPESFLQYTKALPEDARAYRAMVKEIDDGADEAECVIQLFYDDKPAFLRIHMTAIRDPEGHTVKAQAYSIDITEQRRAEERIRKERLRQKSIHGDMLEAFSFNIARHDDVELQTTQQDLYKMPLREEILQEAEHYIPLGERRTSRARSVLLAVANQVPDPEDRELLFRTCGLANLQQAYREGRFENSIRYRRRIGDAIHWVETRTSMLPDPQTGELVAFFYTQDINDHVVRNLISCKIRETNYDMVAYYSLAEDRLSIVSVKEPVIAALDGGSYEDILRYGIQVVVRAEEMESVCAKYSLQNIRQELQYQSVYTVFFSAEQRDMHRQGRPHRHMKNDIFYLDAHRDTLVFLLYDVTAVVEQQREHCEKLEQALHAAESANLAKTEFLSRISHDIRTPMNAIQGMTRFALEDIEDQAKLRRDLEKIEVANTFLMSLINDVLDISKIDSGKIQLNPEPYSFEEHMRNVRNVLETMCAQKGLHCVMERRRKTGVIVVDKVRLNQITLNIISNAVKYTPKGGTVTYISDSENLPEAKIRFGFEIRDTGIGMSRKFQETMFEAFSQEYDNPGRPRSSSGTGLGLSIVKRMVGLMGGSISIQSELGKGTVVRCSIVLPDALRDPAYNQILMKQTVSADAQGAKAIHGKVLLAEDNEINMEIACRILESFGLEVDTAENGKQAVEVFRAAPAGTYKAIFMDIQMPLLNGYEAAEGIRRLERADAAAVPIIAMTADAFSDAMKRGYEAGMNDYVTKPLDIERLRCVLEKVM